MGVGGPNGVRPAFAYFFLAAGFAAAGFGVSALPSASNLFTCLGVTPPLAWLKRYGWRSSSRYTVIRP